MMAPVTSSSWLLLGRAGPAGPSKLPHDNYGPQFLMAVWLLTAIAGLFLILRLYCKLARRRNLWWDDHVLVASFVALVAQTSLLSVCVHLGFGKHSWDVTDWPSYLKVANPTGVCSIIAAAWSKTSFAITLLRFVREPGWTRRFVWFVIGSVNLFLGLSALFTYVQCWPVARLWDSTVEGTCWPQYVIVNYNSFSSAYSGAMDIILALLPWWIINKRSLSKKERFGVLVAMSMGVFAGITSIAKTATLWAISDPDLINGIALMILATAETALTIIAASVPVLRALVSVPTHHEPQFYRYYNSQDQTLVKPSQLRSYGDTTSPLTSPPGTGMRDGPGHQGTGAILRDLKAGIDLSSQRSNADKTGSGRETGGSWLYSTSGLNLAGTVDVDSEEAALEGLRPPSVVKKAR